MEKIWKELCSEGEKEEMNYENLHTIINRYENDLENIPDERVKWRALKSWQEAFHSSDSPDSFRDKFRAAKKYFSFLIDNGFQHPSSGVLKLWEAEPEAIEHLFTDVLLSDPKGEVQTAENQMNQFLWEYELLRIKHFPSALSYKIDPHIATVFMTLDNPDLNYIFRIGVARNMARYIGFEEDLGKGEKPNLMNYYKLGDLIVSAFREHDSLLQKHFSLMDEDMQKDQSLHLMVFDLMHCSGYRGYYTGLVPTMIGVSKKRKAYVGPSAEEIAQKEQMIQNEIISLQQRIAELEAEVDEFEEISLLGVEVEFNKYGIGTVIEQQGNHIIVQFQEKTMEFVLDNAYPMRPKFENDKVIVEALTVFSRKKKELADLNRRIEKLQNQ